MRLRKKVEAARNVLRRCVPDGHPGGNLFVFFGQSGPDHPQPRRSDNSKRNFGDNNDANDFNKNSHGEIDLGKKEVFAKVGTRLLLDERTDRPAWTTVDIERRLQMWEELRLLRGPRYLMVASREFRRHEMAQRLMCEPFAKFSTVGLRNSFVI